MTTAQKIHITSLCNMTLDHHCIECYEWNDIYLYWTTYTCIYLPNVNIFGFKNKKGKISHNCRSKSCPDLWIFVRQQHDRSWSWAPPMLVCKYVDENGLVAKLATKRLTVVTPEVNFRNIHHICLHQVWIRKKHRGGISGPTKGHVSTNFF